MIMARLPVPGTDDGAWGALLNEFLRVAHREDGTLRGVTNVANVLDFGAVADDATDNREAFQSAIDALAATGGGALYVPPGVYRVAPISSHPEGAGIRLRDNITIYGAGTASIIRRTGQSGAGLMIGRGVSKVRISRLAIDLGSVTKNYPTGLHFDRDLNSPRGCADITIDHCYIRCDPPEIAGQAKPTLHAILSQYTEGLQMHNNRIERMQLKASGSGGSGPGIWIVGNRFTDPHNFAASVVLTQSSDVISDVWVLDNQIVNLPSAGGIYVGSDDANTAIGTCKRVRICGNIISGTWAADALGIIARYCSVSEDWIIDGNILDNDGSIFNGSFGIFVKGPPGATLESLKVRGNTVRSVDHAGIQVTGTVDGLVVADNHVYGSRGIRVIAGAAGIANGAIHHNVARGKQQGILTQATNGSIRKLQIDHNTCWNHTGSTTQGILLQCDAGQHLQATLAANVCFDDQSIRTQQYGIRETGAGTWDTAYAHCDLRGNASAGLQGINSAAYLHENRLA